MITIEQKTKAPKASPKKNHICAHNVPVEACLRCKGRPENQDYLSQFKSGAADEDDEGFHPGFPPGFDPQRAERGLAQENKADEESTIEESPRSPQVNEFGVYVKGEKKIKVPLPKKAGKSKVIIRVVQDQADKLWRSSHSATAGTGAVSGPIMESDPGYESREEALGAAGEKARAFLLRTIERGVSDNVKRQVEAAIVALDDWMASNARVEEASVQTGEAIRQSKKAAPRKSRKCIHDIPVETCGFGCQQNPIEYEAKDAAERACRVCGCTDLDCRHCIEKTGAPCHWVELNLCSACAPALNGHPVLDMIPIDQIEPSPTNPRKFFDEGKLQELADSILAHGLVEPILVRPRTLWQEVVRFVANQRRKFDASKTGYGLSPGQYAEANIHFKPGQYDQVMHLLQQTGRVEPTLGINTLQPSPGAYQPIDDPDPLGTGLSHYEIVFGERRWRATERAGLARIKAEIRDLDDQAALEIQMIENLQRVDISPVEEADGYSAMLQLKNDDGTSVYTVDSLAARIGKKGKSKSYVYGRLKLRNLPTPALDALAKGDLPTTIAELIGRLPSMELREEFWKEHYSGLGEKWFEAPSFRQVKEIIESDWMRELKSAPFSQIDKKLLPGVPSCKDCPKRIGNDRINYPDSRADICTDTDCYDQKVQAFNRRKLAEVATTDSARVLSPEESQRWFTHSYLADTRETEDYIDLSEECDEAADSDDYEADIPTYGQLLGNLVKPEVVGLDKSGNVHQLVSRKAAEAILKEKGIKITSPAQTETDRKASQQKHREEKHVRDQAAAEICQRVMQSLTDKPFTLTRSHDSVSPFLHAVALHLIHDHDSDPALFVAKRRQVYQASLDVRNTLIKVAAESAQTALELIVELLIAEELDWWIRAGEHAGTKFRICEYFGFDPRKIEKRIAKESAAAKKAKPKAKAKAASGR